LPPLVRQDCKLLVIGIFVSALNHAALGPEKIACKGTTPAPAVAKKVIVGNGTAAPVAAGVGDWIAARRKAARSLLCDGKCAD
jgi:hypothetical protein